MVYISYIPDEEASPNLKTLCDRYSDPDGVMDNILRIQSRDPDSMKLHVDSCRHLMRGPLSRSDVDGLRAHGSDDHAILDICQVTAYFNFANRLADGLGVELEGFWSVDDKGDGDSSTASPPPDGALGAVQGDRCRCCAHRSRRTAARSVRRAYSRGPWCFPQREGAPRGSPPPSGKEHRGNYV